MPKLSIFMFGGLRVERDGQPLPPFPTHKVRALFAYLVTFRERSHPRSVLAGLFWPDNPEDRARRNLSDALWRLRQVVGSETIRIEEEGLAFNRGGNYWLDVEQFQTLCAQAPPGSRLPLETNAPEVENLHRAVELYQGEFLEGFYEDWALLERERLHLRYLTVLEQILAWLSDRGEYGRALDYGLRLVASDPLRESGHRQVILLYHRLGQRHAALRQFETCCQILRDELGEEPLPETVRLAEEIREGGSTSRTPFDDFGRVPLVGRQEERMALLTRVDKAHAGRGGLVLIEGEPGVGKTRLVEEVARSARWRGFQVLWGTCRDWPYAPLVEALEGGLTPHRVAQLIRLVDSSLLAALAPLFPTLLDERTSASLPPLDWARQGDRLHRALASCMVALDRIAPHLLVLEDWQWMDPATLEVLPSLVASLSDTRWLIVGTARVGELRAREEVWEQVRSLDRDGLLEHVTLPRLSFPQTHELVGRVLGRSSQPSDLSQPVYESTQGNPLFVVEWIKALVEAEQLCRDEAGTWQLTAESFQQPPTAIQRVISARLNQLSPHEWQLLAAAAVLGSAFDFELWCGMVGEERGILAGSDELLRRQLVTETNTGYRFAHDLIHQVVYGEITAEERRHWHHRAGLAMERLTPENVEALAYHFDQADDHERALRYHLRAGDRARSLFANQAALHHYGQVVSLGSRAGAAARSEHLARAYTQRASIHILGGDYAAAEADYRAALKVLEWKGGDSTDRAAALHGLGWLKGYYLCQREEGVDLMERARDLYRTVGDNRGLALSISRIGHVLAEDCRWDEAISLYQEVQSLCRRTDDWTMQARALMGIGVCYLFLIRPVDAVKNMEEALSLYRQRGDRWGEAKCLANLGQARLRIPNFLGALTALRQAWAINEEIGATVDQPFILIGIAYATYSTGDLAEAQKASREGLALLEGSRGMASVEKGMLLYRLAQALYHAGEIQQARDTLRDGLDVAREHHPPTAVSCLCSLADLDVLLGDLERATSRVREALSLAQEIGFRAGEAKSYQSMVQVALARGDLEEVSSLLGHVIEGMKGGFDVGRSKLVIGEYWLAAGRPARTLALARRVDQGAQEAGALILRLEALCLMGRGWLALERQATARDALSEALAQAKGHSLPIFVCRAAAGLAQAEPDSARMHLEQAWASVERMADRIGAPPLRRALLTAPWAQEIEKQLRALRQVQGVRQRVSLPRLDGEGSERVQIIWTVDEGEADAEIERREGRVPLRRARILRLLEEARAQGGIPTQADLARALSVSVRTIRSDVAALRQQGHIVETQGTSS